MEDGKIEIPSNVTLKIIDGQEAGTDFTITKKSIIIGREDISDLKLTDQHTSNRHCQIVFRSGHFTAIDLGSLNKTKVNDKIYVQKNLRDKDIITLGKTKIQFNWEGQDEYGIDSSEDILTEKE